MQTPNQVRVNNSPQPVDLQPKSLAARNPISRKELYSKEIKPIKEVFRLDDFSHHPEGHILVRHWLDELQEFFTVKDVAVLELSVYRAAEALGYTRQGFVERAKRNHFFALDAIVDQFPWSCKFLYHVPDDSLAPEIPAGAWLRVNNMMRPKRGDVVVVNTRGGFTVGNYCELGGKRFRLEFNNGRKSEFFRQGAPNCGIYVATTCSIKVRENQECGDGSLKPIPHVKKRVSKEEAAFFRRVQRLVKRVATVTGVSELEFQPELRSAIFGEAVRALRRN